MLEHYRETHEVIFRYKSDAANKEQLSKFLIDIGQSLRNNSSIEITKILSSKEKATTTNTIIGSMDPIAFIFLYAKENHKLEIHMELEWTPK